MVAKALLLSLVVATGCRNPYDHTGVGVDTASQVKECDSCHGSDGNSAPPMDTTGGSATSERGVGAHRAHVGPSDWHAEGLCRDCHVVPILNEDPGHIDTPLPAELTWSARAMGDGARPTWDGATCTNYCHGETMQPGGSLTQPLWTVVDGSQAACGTCHGSPPEGNHPSSTPNGCVTCHGAVIAADGSFVNPELHINGVVDVELPGPLECDACHGSNGVSAPPEDTLGHVDTASVGVGAHRAHVGASNWHAEVACEECHKVPTDILDAGHIDSPLPAELTWGPTASAAGVRSAWDGASCTTYCHGDPLWGGTNTAPAWTTVDGTQAACGTCHGLAPAAPHPATSPDGCVLCHGMVVDGNLDFIAPERHINGVVDVTEPVEPTCWSCHGSEGDPAPPQDVSGFTDPAEVGVGAHQVHLASSDWHNQLVCEDCHVVPERFDAPGHMDTPLPAELAWSALASAEGSETAWDGVNCTTYCHGETLSDGLITQPEWTKLDGTQSACDACHGAPPGAPHPAGEDCSACHGMVLDAVQNFIAPDLHINGVVDVEPPLCTACHGQGIDPAPPRGLLEETLTTDRAVGAHQAHLAGSNWHRDVLCTDCHVVPTGVDDAGHLDTWRPAELTWSEVAAADGAAPTWDGATCTNYCHGQTLIEGGINTAPTWTLVNGTQGSCGTCHGLPPQGSHPQSGSCAACHGMVINSDFSFNNPDLHINGVVDVVSMSCDACHGSGGEAAPPRDTTGGTATSATGVGAHRQHLATSDWHGPVTCEDCHTVPTSIGSVGHIDSSLPAELTWGALATAGNANPAWDGATCTTYCHGQTLKPGGSNLTPTWTTVDGTQAACGTCHGLPPNLPHPQSTTCSACHGMVIDANGVFTAPDLHVNGQVDVVSMACDTCHGSNGDPAPPNDTQGNTDTGSTGVGAHQQHLTGGDWHRPVVCEDCHRVPTSVGSSGHVDALLPAELTWGAVATADGATPAWDGASCTNYCHGDTLLAGGTNTAPAWTTVDGTQAACGTCHGTPPDGPHPQNSNCALCHGDVIAADGSWVDPTRHVDGTVDVIPMSCDTCHGSTVNPAPPTDTQGRVATSLPSVGAHQSHLKSSNWHGPVGCADCHLVPTDVSALGHVDTPLPAELTWSALATADAASPAWNGASCTNYCHGQTLLPGGTNKAPSWTKVDGTQAACGTCHGLPPAGTHPAIASCELCHGMVIAADGSFVDPSRHINGVVNVISMGCDSCHGTGGDPAPPTDLSGNTDTTATGVGAHAQHLANSGWHNTIVCSDCHQVPTGVDALNHIDGTPGAELTWGVLAQSSGATPSWDGATCTNYCHGDTLNADGTNTTPAWTQVDGTQAACGTCHGTPPGGGHPQSSNCSLCHGDVIAADGSWVDPSLHINGQVDVAAMGCDSCHGGGGNPAPPTDLAGNTATTGTGVGAHRSHLGTSTWHGPVTCNNCHIVPTTVNAPGHRDGDNIAEVTFTGLAQSGGASSAWNGTTCTTYCHGQTLYTGGSNTTPNWTSVNGTQASCGTCHGLPPSSPHPQNTSCELCHGDVIGSGGAWVDSSRHINGVVDVISMNCDTCHGGSGIANPPRDTSGNTVTTARGVGAHASHLGATDWHADLQCADCHKVPTGVGDVGHIDTPLPAEVVWGTLARTNGSATTWNGTTCANYCHGQTIKPGGTLTTPNWTKVDGTQAACGTCHGAPPNSPHPQNTACEVCHGMVIDANGVFVDRSKHINGVVDVIQLACDSCHGSGGNPAPPNDTQGNTVTTATGVGAHAQHLANADWHRVVACTDCHVVPGSVGAPGHMDANLPAELTWGAVPTANGSVPSWDGATCTNYCHGDTLLPGGSNTTPDWTTVDGTQAACGTCHGAPPGGSHPQSTACATCHGDVIAADGSWVDATRHIDGTVDVVGMACNSCHGSVTNNAPPKDTSNNSATTVRGVGAHQSHMKTSTWRGPIVCTDCHIVPSSVAAVGHIDTPLPAELAFSALAKTRASSASFSGTTCTTYCHGDKLMVGGTLTKPTWTKVDGTQAACGTCHGTPPGGTHPSLSNCELCHGAVIGAGGVWKDATRHVDGTVDVISMNCDTCHGGLGDPAPPVDLKGNSATTARGVGAHQSHLVGSDWHAAVQCADCHKVPTAVDSVGHIDGDGVPEVTFGARAKANGMVPSWSGTTCAAYCHGSNLNANGTLTTPNWTKVDGTQAACGTCHGAPPALPHPQNTACEKCHGAVKGAGSTWTNGARHIDGVLDVIPMTCTTCHGSGGVSAPPVDTKGNTATTNRGVGAHRSHVNASTWRAAIACSECHTVPNAWTDVGHLDTSPNAEVRWGTTSKAQGAVPAWNGATCTNYCHGQTLTGKGTLITPNWTKVDGTQAACGTCHGAPPALPHPQNSACDKCHGAVKGPGTTWTDASRHINGVLDVIPMTCSTCHGAGSQPAPPVDTAGGAATTARGVGAHASHLGATTWHADVQCADCHNVPNAWTDAGHIDTPLPAELTWGALAKSKGAVPAWNGSTCTNYCHGQTLVGKGTVTTPKWTQVDGTQAACGTCHGAPPASPHPQNTACEVCHGMVIDSTGTFVDRTKHINGVVDVIPLACDTCHGSGGNPAPPNDTQGNTATTATGVGAHAQHLANAGWHRDVVCSDCHVVPGSVGALGHMDANLPAELTWGAVPTANGAVPSWDGASCTNYCHGDTLLPGGTNTAPVWTTVDGTQAACGTCHGAPPGGSHPQSTACATCHGDVIAADGSWVDPTRHVDGVVDVVSMACNSCHGSVTNNAPPTDTSKNTSTFLRGVGAHQSHMKTSTWRGPVVCTDCHKVPNAVGDVGHIDTLLPAELTFSALAKTRASNASFSGTTCTTYCHGDKLMVGGTLTKPTWTKVDGTQAACGTCHGTPPGGTHPTLSNCELCHGAVIGAGGTWVDATRHVDGTVDVISMNCDTCHGGLGDPAPPVDLKGNSATTARGVGAHQSHLAGSAWHAAVVCTDCHKVPTAVDSVGHIDGDGVPEVIFGALAKKNGMVPSWSGTTCAAYCHGSNLNANGTLTTPNWTKVDGTQAACGTCHGAPPSLPHPQNTSCEKCHGAVKGAGTAWNNGARHIDGVLDVIPMTCTTCHGSGGVSAPPVDTKGNTATTVRGVGAHRSHVNASTWRAPIACDECHVVPVNWQDPGHLDSSPNAELAWGAVSTAAGAVPAWNGTTCTNYCHGQTLTGKGTLTTPTWAKVDGTQAACGTCHGAPPALPHPQSTTCDKCHGAVKGTGTTWTDASRHVDGVVDVIPMTCTTCHGFGTQPAPPVDTTGKWATTNRGVGAHASHVGTSDWRKDIACAECHVVPTSWKDPGHLDMATPADVTFGALASSNGSSPSWNGGTCVNYCHGETLLAGGSNITPKWTQVDNTQAACGTCHGAPPPSPHPNLSNCELCHGMVAGAGGTWTDRTRHVDGTLDVIVMTCTTCHGTGTDPAPPQDTVGNTATSNDGVGAHQSHLGVSAWHNEVTCDQCHTVPNAWDDVGHIDDTRPADLTWGWLATAHNTTPTYTGGTCTNYCHGETMLVPGSNNTPSWTTVNGSQAACGTCHGAPPGGTHPNRTDCATCHGTVIDAGGNFINPSLHIDGRVNVICLDCHSTAQGPGGYRRPITKTNGDFNDASHHVSNGTTTEIVTTNDCVVCHEQLNHKANVEPGVLLNDPDGGAAFVYDGAGASVENFCLACHDANSSTAYDTNPTKAGNQPFTDGNTPVNVDDLWVFASHNTTTPVALGDDKCMTCHGGVDSTQTTGQTTTNMHGSSFPKLLSPKVVGVNVANHEESLCYACHKAGGIAGTNLQAEFAKGTNGANIYHHPVVDAQQSGGRSVECTDCHNPHGATPTDPLMGATGIDTSGAAVGPYVPVAEYEICNKCHGDTRNTGRPRTTNKRTDFDPTNSSFHPVAGPGRNTSTAMANGLRGGLTVTSTITCSDCHNSQATAGVVGPPTVNSTVAPQGPHGSSYPFILRDNYWSNPQGPTSWNPSNFTLCLDCHDVRGFNNRNEINFTNFASTTRNYHELHLVDAAGDAITCANCHYNTHSNENMGATTNWRVNGVLYTSPPAGFKTRGISFSPDMTGAGGMAKPTFDINTSTRLRGCYVNCHGKSHTPKTYRPSTTRDNDPLTIP